ncbi:tetratricopeptide repeat protein [Dactylosporangium sp. CA-052675]|uniref:tetratricopeptide repeat protein n=1 Tax=Dactylosporangium sp. CA-052675 TaxID=3239927 RepID=UPI003D91EEA1
MTATATICVDELLAAARGLALAARWEQATGLLDAAAAGLSDSPARAVLALAAAEIAVDSAWYSGTEDGAGRLCEVDEDALDDTGRWDLGFARLRYEYRGKLRKPDSDLRDRAERFAATAPDARRLGWAHHYLGLIHDNVLEDRAAAPAHYERALANAAGDDLLRREAQRHLGDHAHEAGNHAEARERWQEATAVGARAGLVAGTLSQQLLLAVLARDTGDEPGAVALATEVHRWAEAIGAARIAELTSGFLHGVDPTQPPPA